MRRRSRMKTLKILRLFAQGRIVVFIMLLICTYISGEPGYLDFDNLPETNFTCAGKVIGGYYADLEASCQMFHVCTIGQLDEPMDIKFLCLNGTVFDQETRVCERVDEVDCTKSEKFYYLNLELYGNTMLPVPEVLTENDNLEETSTQSSTSTTTTKTTTTPTTTMKPTTTPASVTQLPVTSTQRLVSQKTTVPPKLNSVISSTTTSSPTHFVTTQNSYSDDTEEEYEYDDDYSITDGKELQSYQDTSSPNSNQASLAQHVFSPEQFIFRQNNGKSQAKSANKPAISFQQQQFQNGGSLTVTNSHVTVTTHTSDAGLQGQNNINNINKQFSSKPKEGVAYSSSSTTQKPQFSLYNALPQPLPKRIPLLPQSSLGPPSGHPGLSQVPAFRQNAQGFRLPTQQLQAPATSSFEGYRRHLPQVSLRLPVENGRSQKEILGFDDVADDFPPQEHKDLKRSDSSNQLKNITLTEEASTKSDVTEKKTNDNQHERSVAESITGQNSNYDRVLLTPQDQYIPTLPKIIITASASVSDASGKKLSNYSVGNVLGSNAKNPPLTYDEYKEDDVVLDPFFLDVPKIKPRRSTREIKLNSFNKIVKKKRKSKLIIN